MAEDRTLPEEARDENLLDIIERHLGTTIDDPALDERAMSLDQHAELVAVVERYHRQRALPQTSQGEVRPAIFAGSNVGFRYPSPMAFMVVAKQVVRAATYDVKRVLLYSHRVVMPDPVLIGRDRGEAALTQSPDPDGHLRAVEDTGETRRDASRVVWRSALHFYREYDPLIRRGHLMLIDSDRLLAGTLGRQIDLERPLRQVFDEQRTFDDFDRFSSFAVHAIAQLAHREKFDHRVDPFFASTEICDAYRLVLQRAAVAAPGARPFAPSVNAVLAGTESIDPSKLSSGDIVQMRESEELFAIWRGIVEHVLMSAHRQAQEQGAAADLGSLIEEQGRLWQSELTRLVGKSSVLEGALDKTAVSLGIVSGVLTAVHGDATMLEVLGAAGAGGVLAPLFTVLFNALGRLPASAERRSLDHHFLALGKSR